jgi:hypothetical protein
MTKIFVFQPILNCFTILESLEKVLFKKLRLIVSSIYRFFVNFSSILKIENFEKKNHGRVKMSKKQHGTLLVAKMCIFCMCGG